MIQVYTVHSNSVFVFNKSVFIIKIVKMQVNNVMCVEFLALMDLY